MSKSLSVGNKVSSKPRYKKIYQEIIIVDGMSTDGTRGIINGF